MKLIIYSLSFFLGVNNTALAETPLSAAADKVREATVLHTQTPDESRGKKPNVGVNNFNLSENVRIGECGSLDENGCCSGDKGNICREHHSRKDKPKIGGLGR